MAGFWAAATFWMGTVGSYSLMLVARAVRGTAEGPLFPLANSYVRHWFPPGERGGANAIWTSGSRVGLALAVPVLALIIEFWGWRAALLLQGLFILVLLVPAIWFLTADTPERMPRVGAAELTHIREGKAPASPDVRGRGKDLAELVRNYRFWLMVFYHFAVLATASGLITWLPKYLREARGFEVGQMVLFAALPHLGCFLSSLTFGFLSDRIGHRALLCTLSQAGSAAAVGLAVLVASPIASAWLMVLGMVFWGMGSPVYYAIMQRIIPPSIMATGIGIDNGLANFGAALAPAVIGFLIGATGSYEAGLLFLAGLGMIGAAGAAVLAIQRY
jgi:sugar phosphate permease